MSILVNNKAHGFTDGLTVGGKSAHNATRAMFMARSTAFLNLRVSGA
jgi:hypothetical protein